MLANGRISQWPWALLFVTRTHNAAVYIHEYSLYADSSPVTELSVSRHVDLRKSISWKISCWFVKWLLERVNKALLFPSPAISWLFILVFNHHHTIFSLFLEVQYQELITIIMHICMEQSMKVTWEKILFNRKLSTETEYLHSHIHWM